MVRLLPQLSLVNITKLGEQKQQKQTKKIENENYTVSA